MPMDGKLVRLADISVFHIQTRLFGKRSLHVTKSVIQKISNTIRSSAGESVLSGNVLFAVRLQNRKSKKVTEQIIQWLEEPEEAFLEIKG